MYLNKIILYNYRPYYAENTINLGYNEKSNVNIIYANNARGKSSLLNAITWAFYGKELHDMEERANPIYNKIAAKECENGDNFNVKVTLELVDINNSGDEVPFKVERCETYFKDNSGEITRKNQKLDVLDLDGEWHSDDQTKIDSVISKIMHKYFFFNGEQLDNYFDKKDIKKTIERISQIDLISTVNNHLSYVNRKYNEDISKLDDDIEPVINKLNETRQRLGELRTEETKLNEDIESLNELIKSNTDRLEELKGAKEKANRRNDLLKDNEDINARLSKNEEKYFVSVVELYAIMNLFDPLYDVAKMDTFDKDDTNVSSDFTLSKKMKEVYEYILREDVCICGVDFTKNPEHRVEIQEKLNKLNEIMEETGETDDNALLDIVDDAKDLLDTLEYKYERINMFRQTISTDKDNLKKNNEELLRISRSLTSSDDNDIRDAENALQLSNDSLNRKQRKLNETIRKIGQEENKEESLTKKRDEIVKNITAANALTIELGFCERAVDVISDLNDNLRRDILDKISDLINSQVSSEDFTENGLGRVRIDNKFNVSLKDYMGDLIYPGDLSGGQRRSLALAFIISLNKIGGFNLPLFIDAPFSTLDDEHIQKFVDNLPKFTKDKQLIFLFIEDVYNKGIDDILNPYITKKIKLNRKQEYITEVLQ